MKHIERKYKNFRFVIYGEKVTSGWVNVLKVYENNRLTQINERQFSKLSDALNNMRETINFIEARISNIE